jgi:ferredoxin like protein
VQVDTKLAQNLFRLDKEPHITIDQRICATACVDQVCTTVCPADLYEVNGDGRIVVNWEGCLECGACMICCENGALSWSYPRGGFGVQYRFG